MLNFKSKKGEIATLLTLGLVVVGTLITLGTSLFVNNKKNLASNPKAADCIARKCLNNSSIPYWDKGGTAYSKEGCWPADALGYGKICGVGNGGITNTPIPKPPTAIPTNASVPSPTPTVSSGGNSGGIGGDIVGEGQSCCFGKNGKIYVFATYESMVNNDMLDDNGNVNCARQSAAVQKSYQADERGAFVCPGGATNEMSQEDYDDLVETNKPTDIPTEATIDCQPWTCAQKNWGNKSGTFAIGIKIGSSFGRYYKTLIECQRDTTFTKGILASASNQEEVMSYTCSEASPDGGGNAIITCSDGKAATCTFDKGTSTDTGYAICSTGRHLQELVRGCNPTPNKPCSYFQGSYACQAAALSGKNCAWDGKKCNDKSTPPAGLSSGEVTHCDTPIDCTRDYKQQNGGVAGRKFSMGYINNDLYWFLDVECKGEPQGGEAAQDYCTKKETLTPATITDKGSLCVGIDSPCRLSDGSIGNLYLCDSNSRVACFK